ncbi:MAG: A/G-specific adenine glycosylase [Comamonas sp.]|nr:A/G-specific adenine glycosylase [Comamonas sp.]
MTPSDFADRVVRWQAAHGRCDLPWQGTRDPYRVWLSEIMLQQTQVATVIGYYARFLARFPHVRALAAAEPDEVLALWSGLGYYSRARHLHRCAQMVAREHGGVFPQSAAELQKLPGIGRSTAAAIAAFCFGERAAILDGNVRRVLTRVLGFGADLVQAANERALWRQAQQLLPQTDVQLAMPRYTQGLMDLGATVCLAKNPQCDRCPLADLCVARRQGDPQRYPVRTRQIKRRVEAWWLLLYLDGGRRCWLAPRPPRGIWAGLYCPPVQMQPVGSDVLGSNAAVKALAVVTHALTHRELQLHPVVIRGAEPSSSPQGAWFGHDEWQRLGLPAPIRRLLDALCGE